MADLFKVFLNDSMCLTKLLLRQANRRRQGNSGREPELCLSIRVGHVNMDTWLLSREEKQAEWALAQYGGGHGSHCTRMADTGVTPALSRGRTFRARSGSDWLDGTKPGEAFTQETRITS